MQRLLTLLFCLWMAQVSSQAEVRLPGFFGDHMVFQRDIPIPVWGWADPGEKVTVLLGDGGAVEATADALGRWSAKLPVMKAGGPHQLVVTGRNKLVIQDVLVGEVWLCSGQSNMEWTVGSSLNPEKEIPAANHPKIRHMKVSRVTAGYPQEDLKSTWQVCSPATVGSFTAAGYFMARKLHEELDVPIGLINSSWGGTRIEPWTPIAGFEQVPDLKDILQQVRRTQPGNPEYRAAMQKLLAATQKWTQEATTALEAGQPLPVNPEFPAANKPLTRNTDPTALYNAMIHPLVGYGMRGAIWYQGESNHAEGMLYHEKKKALVQGWRKIWGLGGFPFYYVQIAPYQYGNEDPTILPRFWEAQSASLEIPHTGMIVTSDIGNVKDIHPKNKQEVGRRLALLALKNDYGRRDLVASGPVMEAMAVEGKTLRIRFKHGEGLKSRDGKTLTDFEIIGEQGAFVKADARIDGSSVILSSPEVQKPAAMRFAWNKLAEPNLQNGAGLPASAFRAGEIPKVDYLSLNVPESQGMELLYELDLKKLGRNPKYLQDRSGQIRGTIDRVAYYMELHPQDQRPVFAFVSMDPFTGDLKKLGVPTPESKAHFQTSVKNMNIVSNSKDLQTGDGLAGNIEFWPNNYATANSANVTGASGSQYDIGDQPADPVDGYGCMQVHNTRARQTVFSLNQWKSGDGADLGIGNSPGETRDWTFNGNARSYQAGTLKVFVRLKK